MPTTFEGHRYLAQLGYGHGRWVTIGEAPTRIEAARLAAVEFSREGERLARRPFQVRVVASRDRRTALPTT